LGIHNLHHHNRWCGWLRDLPEERDYPAVAQELRNQPQGTRAQRVMLMTIDGSYTLPVNYLHEDDVVYVGADGPWWHELTGDGLPVALLIKGQVFLGQARAIVDQPQLTRDVFKRLRPALPGWVPDFLSGVLVKIELDPETGTEGEY